MTRSRRWWRRFAASPRASSRSASRQHCSVRVSGVARGGPVRTRLALVGLARAPALPSLAIAFVAVSVGLGGFALAYRATLIRGAADRLPTRSHSTRRSSPGRRLQHSARTRAALALAGARGRARCCRYAAPRRTTRADRRHGHGPGARRPRGAGFALIHGWRTSDGSAPLSSARPAAAAARRAARVPGPALPRGADVAGGAGVGPAPAVDGRADR